MREVAWVLGQFAVAVAVGFALVALGLKIGAGL